jgi:hypothetical protein
MTHDEIREWVAHHPPPKITDPAILDRVITLAFTGLPEQLPQPERQADGDARPPARPRGRRRR